MLRSATNTYSASVNGLNTDGNDLAHEAQSNLSESNYELCRDGTRRRRRAVIEETIRPNHVGIADGSFSSAYVWRTPNRIDNLSIMVEQRNGQIFFYEMQHESPTYVRENELYMIEMRMWGTSTLFGGLEQDIDTPCTYAEGNGSLYIFNRLTGTLKVEYLDNGTLRTTPIGTWIRDYEGASEVQGMDFRETTPNPSFTRRYNLSNTGWDWQGISDFNTQSGMGYEIQDPTKASIGNTHGNIITVPAGNPIWPAVTDRYLSGRQLDESGAEYFSFKQLIQAKRNRSMPAMGSRIRSSAFHPAGTHVGIPNNMTLRTTITPGAAVNSIDISVVFDEELDLVAMNGRTNLVALFIHYLVLEVDGVEAGFSGVFRGRADPDQLNRVTITITNAPIALGTNYNVVQAYIHPGPVDLPHHLIGATTIGTRNDSFYDFQQSDRPEVGEFYAGRLWQGSDRHNRVYYSQQIEAGTRSGAFRGVARESLCYAAADPTDGFDSFLVATDGGYINLPDSGTHYGLVTLGSNLYILTDRGIWVVAPGSSGFFLADDFTVQRISNGEVLGYRSWVVVDNELHVATDEGILVIGPEGIGSITDERIRIRYDEIIAEEREVIAAYDPETYVVRWAFPDQFGTTTVQDRLGTTMLSYHRLHNAWFQYDFPQDYTIVDMVVIPYTARVQTYNKFRYLVVARNFDVLQLGEPLSSEWGVEANLGPSGFDEWVESHSERFTDFLDSTGDPVNVREPMPAFMQTNHWLLGQGGKFTQIKYLVAHNKNVTTHTIEEEDGSLSPNIPGSTLVTAQWDWFDADHQNKFSKPHQTYRFRRSYFRDDTMYDRGEPNIVAKIKVRGRGREFRLLWEAEGQNDSHLTGWVLDGLVMGET